MCTILRDSPKSYDFRYAARLLAHSVHRGKFENHFKRQIDPRAIWYSDGIQTYPYRLVRLNLSELYQCVMFMMNFHLNDIFISLKALLMKIRHSNFQNSNFSILVDCRKWQDKGLGNLFWFESLCYKGKSFL